jgi:4-hydroxybenzoyl-CoA thioesterase/acyl-CoA thioester hydrolase
MPPLQTRRRVEFRDTDAAGIVHFSAFFVWMESAEHELLRAAGVSLMERDADGVDCSWPRVAATCEYTAAVRFGDEVDITVCVEALGRTSVTYGFVFKHHETEVANGTIVAVRCRLPPGGRPEPIPIPPDFAARLEAFAPGQPKSPA